MEAPSSALPTFTALCAVEELSHLLADHLAGALLLDHCGGFRKHLLRFSRRCA